MTDLEVLEGVAEAGGAWKFSVRVPVDSRYFDGHFEGQPILPAVAQLRLVEDLCRQAFGEGLSVESLSRCRFRSTVGPEALLDVQLGADRTRLRWKITSAGEAVADGVMKLGGDGA